jgi:hypothetical protein
LPTDTGYPEDNLDENGLTEQEALFEAVGFLVNRLETEAQDRVNKRRVVERRWLEDLRQYNGTYDDETVRKWQNANKSTLFINETRPQTNAVAARLYDMLFPTDDKNWGIESTPVPQMTSTLKQLDRNIQDAQNNGLDQTGQGQQILQQLSQESERLKKVKDEADSRADMMSDEIDDHLQESNYAAQNRDMIDDASQLGTGIMKGPIRTDEAITQQWMPKQQEPQFEGQPQGPEEWMLGTPQAAATPRMAFVRVDPWNFYPEPTAISIEESDSFFELHLMTRRDLQEMAKKDKYSADAIRRILRNKPMNGEPTNRTELRSLTDENQVGSNDKVYQMWEYRGPMTSGDARMVCTCLNKDELLEEFEDDPLNDIQVEAFFCQGEVVGFEEHFLDSSESIYSKYTLEQVRGSFWGYGIPRIMSDQQAAMNGAWRMMMDNSGLSAAPQIELDPNVVEPVDGKWELKAGKIWKRLNTAPAGAVGVNAVHIPNNQTELINIIELTKRFIDDETSVSSVAKGEQGTHTTTTASGMAMLMNATNTMFRRFLKNFDDDNTVPNIRRAYHWLMQFSDRQEIKGDFNVNARGSSVLLVRELQSQNLMVLAQMTAHPTVGVLLKSAPLMRKLAQAMMISANDIILTDEEIKVAAEKRAGDEQPPEEQNDDAIKAQIAQLDAQTKMQVAQLDSQTKLQIAQMNAQNTQMKAQGDMQIKQEEAISKQQLQTQIDDTKARLMAAEIAVKNAHGQGL